jgi:GTP-binding protein
VRKPNGDGTVFADIPGLIAGAHQGTGLGHDFLRHIERTRLLLHLIDATADDPIANYQIIQQELHAYGRGLADRPQILALNKVDAVEAETLDTLTIQLNHLTQVPVFQISAVAQIGLDSLLHKIWQSLDQLTQEREDTEFLPSASKNSEAEGAEEAGGASVGSFF